MFVFKKDSEERIYIDYTLNNESRYSKLDLEYLIFGAKDLGTLINFKKLKYTKDFRIKNS